VVRKQYSNSFYCLGLMESWDVLVSRIDVLLSASDNRKVCADENKDGINIFAQCVQVKGPRL
jgi:hypothetical protein